MLLANEYFSSPANIDIALVIYLCLRLGTPPKRRHKKTYEKNWGNPNKARSPPPSDNSDVFEFQLFLKTENVSVAADPLGWGLKRSLELRFLKIRGPPLGFKYSRIENGMFC